MHGDVESGTYTIGALLIWLLCCEYFEYVLDVRTMNYVKPDSDRLPDVAPITFLDRFRVYRLSYLAE